MFLQRAAVFPLLLTVVGTIYAQDLTLVPVQGNIYMLAGPAGNVTLQTGNDGVLLVDTMTPAQTSAIVAEITKLSRGKIQYIINTSMDPDHTGGNAAIAKLGVPGASPTDTGVILDAPSWLPDRRRICRRPCDAHRTSRAKPELDA